MNYLSKSMMALCIATCLGACSQQEQYYVKQAIFPENATLEQKVEIAAHLVPTPQQLEWQKMELTAFLHFGVNTFTGREWGDGTEDPAVFNPTNLDADQWVRTLKECGFKMVILTAKHHDGFCLWPTATTKHSVASSKWKDGKGDVVKELRDACTKYDMKFGIYLSPWDRNAECYGDSPKYNQFFVEQLTELLTNYGEVHEVWFDGANGEGPNSKKQEYDWTLIYKTIHELQPKAVTAIMGDDVRWVGNESGLGRDTEWSATVLNPGGLPSAEAGNKALEINAMSKDLGSRDMLAKAKSVHWYPSEVDVSIRPGWFYHEAEDSKVKSLKHMVDIYYKSVGCNSVLLLNIPPDCEGRISQADVTRLKEFAVYINQTFSNNLLKEGNQYWTAKGNGESKTYDLQPDAVFNTIMLQEDIAKGQRVEEFTVEAFVDNTWKEIAKGTTIGYKKLLRVDDLKAEQLKVTIKASRSNANILNVGAFYAAPIQDMAQVNEWNNLSRENWKKVSAQPLVVDLGKKVTLKAFTYAPAGQQAKPSMAFHYTLYISNDGKQWKEIPTTGEFSNIVNNPIPQTVQFKKEETGRFIKLAATTPDGGKATVELNELGVTVVNP